MTTLQEIKLREIRDDAQARDGGYAAIESYGLIGDGESAALVARDGAIDWWAAPAMDSPPVCSIMLSCPAERGSNAAGEPCV